MTGNAREEGATPQVRDKHAFECCIHECHHLFRHDNLAEIARRAARHLNREHGDELKHNHEAIDEVVVGGHHLHGNSYEVRKYKVYLTSFDVMKRIGKVDGWVVPADRDKVCQECYHEIPGREDRIEENPDDPFCDEWTCRACRFEAELERKKSENQQITEWCA